MRCIFTIKPQVTIGAIDARSLQASLQLTANVSLTLLKCWVSVTDVSQHCTSVRQVYSVCRGCGQTHRPEERLIFTYFLDWHNIKENRKLHRVR